MLRDVFCDIVDVVLARVLDSARKVRECRKVNLFDRSFALSYLAWREMFTVCKRCRLHPCLQDVLQDSYKTCLTQQHAREDTSTKGKDRISKVT